MSDLDQKGRALLGMLTRDTKPTLREMAGELGISAGAVQDRLASLIKAGLVASAGGKARAWTLTSLGRGRIGADEPVEFTVVRDGQRELGAFVAGVRLAFTQAVLIDQIAEAIGALGDGTLALLEAEALKEWHRQGRPVTHQDKAELRP